MRKDSKLAKDLEPYFIPIIQDMLDDNLSSGTGSGGAPSPHALSGGHHSGTLGDTQAPQFLKKDGSRDLTNNLGVLPGVTIDGYDISNLGDSFEDHLVNPDAHIQYAHADGYGIRSAYLSERLNKSVNVGAGLVGGGLLTSDITVDLSDNVAGNGIIISSKVLHVNPGTGLVISGDQIIHDTGDFGDLHTNYTEYAQDENITGQWDFSNNVHMVNATISTDNWASGLIGWGILYDGTADFRSVFANEIHTEAFIADIEQALAGGQVVTKSVALLAEDFRIPISKQIVQVDTTNDHFNVLTDVTGAVEVGDKIFVENSTGNNGIYTVASTTYVSIDNETEIYVDEDITDATVDGDIRGRNYIIVEDFPGFPGTLVFADNDWIRLRFIDRSGGGLVVTDIWGKVNEAVLGDGTQEWRFTCYDDGDIWNGVGAGKTLSIYAGSVVLDYGKSGDGYWEVDALGSDSPFTQIVTWDTDPTIPSNHTLHTRTGNLAGVAQGNAGEFGFIARLNSDQYIKVSNQSLIIVGSDIEVYDGGVGGTRVFKLNPTHPYFSMGNPAPVTFTNANPGFFFGEHNGDYKFRVGEYLGKKIQWDGTEVYIKGELHLDGNSQFDGIVGIATNGGVFQGTGSFASPTTALKIWNDGGVGRIGGYNSAVLQWYADTDGKLYAGQGNVVLSSDGINIEIGDTSVNKIQWKEGAALAGELWASSLFSEYQTMLRSIDGPLKLASYTGGGSTEQAYILIDSDGDIFIEAGVGNTVDITGTLTMTYGQASAGFSFGNDIVDPEFVITEFAHKISGDQPYRGIRSYLTQTASPNTNVIIAIDGQAEYITGSGGIEGVRGGDFTGKHNSPGGDMEQIQGIGTNIWFDGTGNPNIGYAVAGQFNNWVFTNTSGTVNITDAYGVIAGINVSGVGNLNVTRAYGLLIDEVDLGTSRWGLYQSSANNPNYFAGNVGIGTTLPDKPLHLKADTYGMFVLDRTANANVDSQWYITPSWDGAGPAEHLAFGYDPSTANNRVMVITEDGRVGIGDTNPAHIFTVHGDFANYLVTLFNNGNANNRHGLRIQAGQDTNPTVVFSEFRDGNGTRVGMVIGDGSGGVTYNAGSDSRRKDIIEDIPINKARTVLQSLSPFRYRGKIDPDNPERGRPVNVGFAAEEVAKHTEGVAFQDDDGFFSMDYSRLTPYLFALIKDHEQRIEELENA